MKYLLSLLFIIPNLCFAETIRYFSLGLTQTDNLVIQSQSTNTASTQQNIKRSGIETNFSWLKHAIDYTGGYTLEAALTYNKSMDNSGDISHLNVTASRLKALNNHWLMRSSVMLQHYNNAPIEVNSYRAIQLENTWGYLDDKNSGTDIRLNIRTEIHDQDASDHYKTQQIGINLDHYFSHHTQSPYWVVKTGLSRHNATDQLRDFDSLNLGLEYRQWSLGSVLGTAKIQWQTDHYHAVRDLACKPFCGINPRFELAKVRLNQSTVHYAMAAINLSKTLNKSTTIQLSALLSRYQIGTDNRYEGFYQLASHINWAF